MRIVIVSLYFPPRIGGLENIMFGLARRWHETGHQVVVFTVTPGDDNYGFPVIRSISPWKLIKAVRASDVFFEANISLKTWWAGILFKRKWFVSHHLPYTQVSGWKSNLKNQITRFSHNSSASSYIAGTLKGKSVVIPNFFSDDFVRMESIKKDRDIVFVGRLVSDKGADDLVRSLAVLKSRGIAISCTIIGDGPEKDQLNLLIGNHALEKSVTLKGPLKGLALVAEINAHKIMVIPSRWPEPFGIVVLEGLACGCRIVCSAGGGLPEAANGFGLLFPNHDVVALADRIQEAIAAGPYGTNDTHAIGDYLKNRTAPVIADQYLHLFTLARGL
ncbi:MAG TPA: glycosyltransferase family 4 protein [Cyclobacteriaceae bacterium]|nr:glycosyltransferase family 4 protein [Cyclobacteriaceae bacterium]